MKMVFVSYAEQRKFRRDKSAAIDIGGAEIRVAVDHADRPLVTGFDYPEVVAKIAVTRLSGEVTDVLGWQVSYRENEVDGENLWVWQAVPPDRCPPPEGLRALIFDAGQDIHDEDLRSEFQIHELLDHMYEWELKHADAVGA